MYKQKLEEQIKRTEELQSRCGTMDVTEFYTLQREILDLSKKLDALNTTVETTVLIDGKTIHREVTEC